MNNKRKIATVVQSVKIEEEDRIDVKFWLNESASNRLSEVSRLRRSYFEGLNGYFPASIEKIVRFRKL